MVGGRFVNLSGENFSYNSLQQLLRLKNDTIFKKIPHNPIPQLSEPKNDIFSETFSKNVLTPLPHVFEPKTEALFQKSFLLLYSSIYPEDLNPFFGIVALLLLPGHLRAKTEYQFRKKHKKIAPASFSEADAISF